MNLGGGNRKIMKREKKLLRVKEKIAEKVYKDKFVSLFEMLFRKNQNDDRIVK